MSTASARAEARRKAILSRGTDRLAKLTTSARGEDSPVYTPDASGPRVSSRSFLGEDSSDMPIPKPFIAEQTPPPPRMAQPAGLGRSSVTPDPSVWSPEQQQQFMRALMGAGAAGTSESPLQSPLGDPTDPIDPSLPPMDNPLAALLFPQGAGPQPVSREILSPPSKLQKCMPLVHLLLVWTTLLFFVVWYEPAKYLQNIGNFVDLGGRIAGRWDRWASLLRNHPQGSAVAQMFQVQVVPFFWAFLTLEVTMHSVRIFTKQDKVHPPALLRLALPHIGPVWAGYVVSGLKYVSMISALLDDIAGLIVGLGFLVWVAGFFSHPV